MIPMKIQGQWHAVPECAANNIHRSAKVIAFHHRHLVRCLEPMFHVSVSNEDLALSIATHEFANRWYFST